jgi:UDP-glucose 4-epimerase
LQGKPLTIFGDGKQTRAFSYIADVAPTIARVVEMPGAYNQVFNIGADTPCSVLELAQTVCRVMEAPVNIRHLDARDEVVHAFSSHGKIRRYFSDLMPNTDLETGLRKMAAWARQAGARKGKPFRKIEVWRNMPEFWREFERVSRKDRWWV